MHKTTFCNRLSIIIKDTTFLLTLLFFIIVSNINKTYAQQVVIYDNAGTFTFNLPAGTTSATVEVWGAGGGSGSGTNSIGGGGGGGGAYARTVFTNPTAGNYTVVVGAGGTAGTDNSVAGAGGNSYLGSTTLILAQGGRNGVRAGAGGAGGTTATSVGTFRFAGGAGGAGGSNGGGGGGSSAGSGANGTNGIANRGAGGIAPTDGGNGGAGGDNANGFSGLTPGGGGGGAGDDAGRTGGTGATGKVVITYTCNVGPVVFNLGTASTRCQAANTTTYNATSTNSTSIAYTLDATSLAAGNTINTTTGEVTFTGAWIGTSTVTANATSLGCNGATSTHTITTNALAGPPVFSLGSTSSRCPGSNSVTYSATAPNATNITYTLDAASLAAGNTINAATGQVTYLASWTGTATITATSNGCGSPRSTHTANTLTSVAPPVFTLGNSSERCRGGGTTTYTATSINATSITYTLDATSSSLLGGNSINSTTGAVTFNPLYNGALTITATATACGFTATATHTINTVRVSAVDDNYVTTQGTPVGFNVLSNDLCNVDPSSVRIVTQPTGGFLQAGTNGNFTYVSFGSFFGTDTFTYEVCSTFPVTCTIGTVTVEVGKALDDPCSEANKSKTFYLPFPENDTQLRQSLLSAANANNLTANVRNIVSFAVPYPKTVIFYDHWEDGYETTIDSPTQSTTLVWGDGVLTNGIAPGYPTDIIPSGGTITQDNSFPWTRPTTNIFFDGKDKIFSTANISVVKVTGDAGIVTGIPLFNVQNVKTNVADTSRFGQFFVLPFGENVTQGPTTSFNYTGLFVRAQEDGTVVLLDYNGDGTNDVTSPTLNQGEVWFYNGTGSSPGVVGNVNQANDIKAGARVSANKNVGLDLVFGGIDTYGTRNIPVFPSQFYGSTYYSPVYSTDITTPTPVYLYFVNPNPNPITINYTRSVGAPLTGSITVPANNGINFYNANTASATKFVSAGGESYTAVGIIDADPAGSSFDWAYNLIPESRLSSFVNLAWAPGSSDGLANYNPVWITPTRNTTIYVKYNGNVSSGPNQSPCGAFYDVSFTVNELQTQLILDPDNDNTGMSIFNCDETPMAAIWGQRPFGGTPASGSSLDVGYTIEPKCLAELVFATDNRNVTQPSTPITIDVAANDSGYLTNINPLSVFTITQPSNGLATLNPDGTYTYTPNAGFVGLDQFDYQICGESPNQNVCDIATVFINTVATVVPGQNTICGSVFNDLNLNGVANAGENGLGNFNVLLYEDLNKNGAINSGEPLLQTIASSSASNLGFYQFNINQDFRERDEFSTLGSGAGNNGTRNWATNWVEIVETGGFATGNTQVLGTGLQIQGNGATSQVGAVRSANLAGASSALLTYDFNKSTFNAATDFVDVQVASSSTGPWTTLTSYNTTAALTGTGSFSIPVNLLTATTSIRFIESNNASFTNTERVIFDNVQIQSFYDKNYIVQLQTPIPNGYTQTSTPVAYPIAFVGVNNSDCDNVFGLYQYPPVANDDNQSAAPLTEDGANGTVNVLTNDTDLTGNPTAPVNGAGQFTVDLDPTTAGIQASLTNTQGVWTLNTTSGVVTFNPADNYNGTALLTYQLCDPTALCDTAVITFVVSPVNDAPIANDDDETASPLTKNGINGIVNLLINDTDIEGNPTAPLNGVGQFSVDINTTLAGVQNSITTAQGVWTLDTATGNVTFDPATNFIGTATLPYTLCDPAGACDSAIISFFVSEDTDDDGISNPNDLDDDNDGILDTVEYSTTLPDPNGDSDGDKVLNYNDNNQPGFIDTNNDTIDDRYDTDLDGIINIFDLDSDNDGCSDANEYYNSTTADGGDGGTYGTGVPVVDTNGTVNAANYTGSYTNVISVGKASNITAQPVNRVINANSNTTFSVTATGGSGITQYQWQVDSGSGFTNISNSAVYSNSTSNILTLTSVPFTFNGYKYRVIITESNFICANIISNERVLTVYPAPTVTIADALITEGGNLSFPVALSNPSATDITVTFGFTNISTANGDYTTTPVTVTFLAGATTATATVPTTPDFIDELDETFTIAITSTTGTVGSTTDTATGTIVDNDNASIIAADDNIGMVNGITGGDTGINVLDNDTMNGVLLTNTAVVITFVPNGPITVTSDGKVKVSPNTPAGTYTAQYTICEASNPNNCSMGTITVIVTSASIILSDDLYSSLSCNSTGIVGNVLTNDTLNNGSISADSINLTLLTGQNANIILDNLGNLSISNNMPFGQYELTYKVCEKLNPLNCQTAKITIVIKDEVLPTITQLPATNTVSCGTTLNFAQAIATDNCGNVNLSFVDTTTAGNCAGSYTVKRTWTARDTAGNTTTASQTINVQDNQGPVTATTFQQNVNVSCDAIPAKPELVFTDTCSSIASNNYTETINNNSSNSYTIVREWLVSDTCGNTSRFTQNVTVTNPNALRTIESSACNLDTALINMTSLLPSGTPMNGTWTDVDNMGALQGDQFNPFGQSIGDRVFEYKVNTTSCPTTIRVVMKIKGDCLVLDCGTVEVFNAISTNNDGINDKLIIKNIDKTSCYPDNSIEIYNRWGVLVFETKNYNNETNYFDGYSRGRTTIKDTAGLPTGTYYYILNYSAIKDGKTEVKRIASHLYINR